MNSLKTSYVQDQAKLHVTITLLEFVFHCDNIVDIKRCIAA